jgi:hypothetical protein
MPDVTKKMEQFSRMIQQLIDGDINFIQYGDPRAHSAAFSHLRVRLMTTVSGMQFVLKFLHHGAESSGVYFPNDETGLTALHTSVAAHIRLFHKRGNRQVSPTLFDIDKASCFFGGFAPTNIMPEERRQ